MKKNEWEMA